uniref:Uncharacterized protein n=1 Tax=Chromera velia CCMP2878 TaxID=1169474 RepID=A0A0G4GY48_9ALVE|eukprot:Cvel_23822.t1-p1 / transcript=Cvel_23822.t1 / gene=Cvel_23822 / organism=Chromera_velia_CCMP2878 / gene_product=hypothetical protein / transcript_product=hypothetical protein / location=Cvel_scaffold2503:170-22836(+) / protein_length=153 / sequence_SO=supercontig / SO=protein_coding / is_pseudo=false
MLGLPVEGNGDAQERQKGCYDMKKAGDKPAKPVRKPQELTQSCVVLGLRKFLQPLQFLRSGTNARYIVAKRLLQPLLRLREASILVEKGTVKNRCSISSCWGGLVKNGPLSTKEIDQKGGKRYVYEKLDSDEHCGAFCAAKDAAAAVLQLQRL